MSIAAALHDFIEAYESAQERDGQAEVAPFLPPHDHPLYASVLRELVRVDLEYSWLRGRPRNLEHYRGQFPELFESAEDVQAIAFEDYRLRKQAGENISPEEYQRRYGIATAYWPEAPPASVPEAVPAATRDDYSFVLVARSFRRLRVRHPEDMAAHAEQIGSALGTGPEADLFRDLLHVNPAAAEDLARSTLAPPRLGSDFLGFHLVDELGSGAFGRVYLARQKDLADRLVALKVTACLSREPQTLAQLQHPHIVPIYSLHVQPPYQAVCMPYLGSTTLADVMAVLRAAGRVPESGRFLVRLVEERRAHREEEISPLAPGGKATGREGLEQLAASSYLDAVLAMVEQLAEGLAHAHEHGILHRDLKPANVLVSDGGQPMLLDFNLAADLKVRASLAGAWVGGTLPYMAPECLEALSERRECANVRSDIYSLGILLFELLTGQHPFRLPRSRTPEAVASLLAERRQGPPGARAVNPALSPATESIVRKCLEPAPEGRYASARELAEDLRRQRTHRPLAHAPEPSRRERLQKWRRRHPRLAAATAVAVPLACVLFLATSFFLVRHRHLDRLEAHLGMEAFRRDLGRAQVELLSHRVADSERYRETTQACLDLLTRYQILDRPDWQEQPAYRLLEPAERAEMRREAGELMLILARVALLENAVEDALRWNERAATCYGEESPGILWRQRAELLARLGRKDEADALRARSANDKPANARELCLAAAELAYQGRYQEALPLLTQATRQQPQDFRIWFDLGVSQEHVGRDHDAAASYSTCIALAPQLTKLYYRRGAAYLRDKHYEEAAADFAEALGKPAAFTPALLAEIYVERALAQLAMNHAQLALDDLNRAEGYPCPTRVYFIRAIVRTKLGDAEGARRDREEGLRRPPRDEKSWSARGWARLTGQPPDPAGALADFDKALVLNPRSLSALQNKTHVLAEHLGRTREAVAVLDRLLEVAPDLVPARASRGVLQARLGQRAAALADAQGALERSRSPATQYQVAGIYALTSRQESDDRREALSLLEQALRRGYGWKLLDRDPDLDPIRELPEFQRLVAAPPPKH